MYITIWNICTHKATFLVSCFLKSNSSKSRANSQKEEEEKGHKQKRLLQNGSTNQYWEGQTKQKQTKTLPSAVNSAENMKKKENFLCVGVEGGAPAWVYPTVQKPLFKSLKRLVIICEVADEKKTKGEYFFVCLFSRMATCFPQNGHEMGQYWLAGPVRSLPPAGWVRELWKMRPSLIVCCVHSILIICGEKTHRCLRAQRKENQLADSSLPYWLFTCKERRTPLQLYRN